MPICIEGYLVPAPMGLVRILTGHLGLDFKVGDVLSAEQLPGSAEPQASAALPIRLELADGAQLVGVASARVYADILGRGRRPFAVSSRPRVTPSIPSPRFAALERRYLEEIGYASEATARLDPKLR